MGSADYWPLPLPVARPLVAARPAAEPRPVRSRMDETRVSLLKRVRDPRDHESWREFHELYRPLLLNFVRARGIGDQSSAEDVVQELLFSLSRRLPEFDFNQQRGRFRTYLWQAANNAVATWHRRNGRHQQAVELDADSRIHNLAENPAAEPDREFVEELRKRVLEQALVKLKTESRPETWDCFQLHVLDRIPARDVAARIGKSENSVYVNAARVMQKLRELCASYMEELDDDV